MNQKITEKALEIINKRKISAENEALQNKIKAFENKEFKNLYQNYVNQMLEDTKNGIVKDYDQEKKQMQQLLNKMGISSIEPKYFCEKCKDNGIIDGKYCDCLVEIINQILIEKSGFDKLEDFKDSNFDIFDDKTTMKKIYTKMEEWCNSNFNKTLIYISGGTGAGKTHLVKCMANELIKNHHLVYFVSAFYMNQSFIKSYTTKDLDKKQSLLSTFLDSEILIIDDLGTEIRQPFVTNNYLYQVLNERKAKHLPTLITSNLQIADIQDYYDERISSRIIDKSSSICLNLQEQDLRLKK